MIEGKTGLRAVVHKTGLLVGLGVIVTAGVFTYLFSQITWRDVGQLLGRIDRQLLCFFVVLSLMQHVIRTLRYRLLLKSAGQVVSLGRLFVVVLVRSFCVDLLPARTGELVYIYLLRTRLGVELGAATASFALAFLFDIMVLGPLVLLAALSVLGSTLPVPVLLGGGGVLFLCSAAAVGLLPWGLRIGFRILSGLGRLPRVRHFIASTHRQVRRARRAGVYGGVFGLSVGVRLLKYGSMYVLLYALLKPVGYALGELPALRVFLGFVSAEMAASLPASGIAGFGAYEGVWSLVFNLLGFPAALATTTGVSHHLITQVYGYSLGLLAMLAVLLGRSVGRAPRKAGG